MKNDSITMLHQYRYEMMVLVSFPLAWSVGWSLFGIRPFFSPSFAYVNAGLLLGVIYYLLCLRLDPPDSRHEIEYGQGILRKYPSNSRRYYERRLLEFTTLAESIAKRGEGSVVSGTIFVTASLLILGQASQSRPVMNLVLAFASLGIYSLWLFGILYTAKKLDAPTYTRLRRIETLLNVEALTFVAEVAKSSKSWRYVRSPVWGIMLWALTFVGFAILLFSGA